MAQATEDGPWLPALLSRWPLSSRVHTWTAGYAISRWLTRPTHGMPLRTPGDFGFPWECLQCRTDDGFHLSGWLINPAAPRGTVAIFHPVRQDRSHMLERIVFLIAGGYRCVAFDHRAHGESSGRRTSFGYHESRDARAVLDMVRQRWPVEPRLAWGIGMGAAAICFAASRLRGISGVVLENLYPDLQQAFFRQLGRIVPPQKWELAQAVLSLTERRLSVRLAQLVPARHIRDLAPTPLLLVGGADHTEASRSIPQLAANYPAPCEWELVPEIGSGGDFYARRILTFFDRAEKQC